MIHLEITDELRELSQQLLDLYKKNVRDENHSASGNLIRNASYQLSYNGKCFELVFFLPEYWKYLEYGTKPHYPPIAPIEEWVKVKRLVPSTDGKIKTTRQLAYAIVHKIGINGTNAYNVLGNMMDDNNKETQAIIDKMVEDIFNQLEKEIDEEEI